MSAAGFGGEEQILEGRGEKQFLRDALLMLGVTKASKTLLSAFCEKSDKARPLHELFFPNRQKDLEIFPQGRDVIDLFMEFPDARGKFNAQEFAATLQKLQPRL